MTKQTQYQKLTELALSSGFNIGEGKSTIPEGYYVKTFTNPNGDELTLAFDVDNHKVSKGGFLRFSDGGGTVIDRTFTQLKAYLSQEPAKEYPAVELVEGSELEVGVGITYNMYSDRQAYTIVEVVNSKKVVARRCTATLSEDWKPEMIAGGFTAHCTNNHSQTYTYKDEEGNGLKVFTLRKDGRWYAEGESINGSKPATLGKRSEFHDYNY